MHSCESVEAAPCGTHLGVRATLVHSPTLLWVRTLRRPKPITAAVAFSKEEGLPKTSRGLFRLGSRPGRKRGSELLIRFAITASRRLPTTPTASASATNLSRRSSSTLNGRLLPNTFYLHNTAFSSMKLPRKISTLLLGGGGCPRSRTSS